MPRVARIVVPGIAHHITQRGNNQQDVFFVEDDRKVYLRFLRTQAKRFGLRIHGYCLMTNHVHLIAVPECEESLAKAVGRAHFDYTRYINSLHGRSGHLWQGRFYSCALDGAHYDKAMRYVELNPVRAKLVECAWDYAWSSAAVHCALANNDGLLDVAAWYEMMGVRPRKVGTGTSPVVPPCACASPHFSPDVAALPEAQRGDCHLVPSGRNEEGVADSQNIPFADNTSSFESGAAGCTLFARTWRDHLDIPLDDEDLAALRLKTHTGRPLGSDSFLSKMEHLLGRRVRALPSGRPRVTPGSKRSD